ncbi:hypothetical protein B566_EDAN002881 [Ephemera danica]|nr:hypothetical protein B566_EDAN002881 [Ephemera danica]
MLNFGDRTRTGVFNWPSIENVWNYLHKCLRPYHVENTGSRPITEVKQR